MSYSKKIIRYGALLIVALSAASCASTGPYYPGQRALNERYGDGPATVEGRVTPNYSRWGMTSGEREAEKKAIAQDQPFAAVKPSRY